MHGFSQLTGNAYMSCITRRLGRPTLVKGTPHSHCRLTVPFAAGIRAHVKSREISTALIKLLGQAVMVKSFPGAQHKIGMEAAPKVGPYGYTLVIGTSTTPSMALSLYDKVTDKVRDNALIGISGLLNFALIPQAQAYGQEHADGCRSGETGEGQEGQHSCLGGPPVSGPQAALLLHPGQVSGDAQERGHPLEAICAGKSVDGAQADFEQTTGACAHEIGRRAEKRVSGLVQKQSPKCAEVSKSEVSTGTADPAVVAHAFAIKESN